MTTGRWCPICGPCQHQRREIELANQPVAEAEDGFAVARRVASWLMGADQARAMAEVDRAERRYRGGVTRAEG
jgi:hypothetical protein